MTHIIDLSCYSQQLKEYPIDELLHVIQEDDVTLAGRLGSQVAVPPPLCELLMTLLKNVGKQQAISFSVEQDELTTGEAAKMLGVSVPHLRKMLDKGEIQFHRVGSHRRIYTADLLDYKQRRDAREQSMLGKASSELGLACQPTDVLPGAAQLEDTLRVVRPNTYGEEVLGWQTIMTEWDSEYDHENYDDL